MSKGYQPKHLKEDDRMKLFKISCRPLTAAGLTGVMLASTALTPVAAIAASQAADEVPTTTPAIEEVTVDASFSAETQRLIQAAEQKVQVSFDEASALLAAVQADRDEAAGADTNAQQTVDQAQQTVTQSQTAVATADAAVTAELQAQIDSLNQQLTDAKANVAALEQQKSDAEGEKSDLESQKAEAEGKVDELQKALDEANAKLEEAQAALDALGEDPTADEQEAYDKAKEAYDTAVADQAEKQAALEAANATLADLTDQLTAKEGELETANATLTEKQQATASAEAALQQARDGYAAEVEAIKAGILAGQEQALASAQGAYDSAKAAYDEACAAAEDPSTVDRSALDAAEATLAGAQAAYDSALESAGAEAESQAQAAIDASEEAYLAAKADEDACQKVIDEAPGQIEDLESQIATENARVTAAEQAVTDATAEVTRTEQAKDDAWQDLQDLAEAQKEWETQAKPLQEAVDAAQAEVDEATEAKKAADKTVTDLETQIAAIEQQIADLEDQAGDVQTQAVDDICDFMVWLRQKTLVDTGQGTYSDCSAALGYLAHAAGDNCGWGAVPQNGIEDYTHLGDPTDATYIDNVLAALDMIDQLNAIRESEGLDPVKVSLGAMVESAFYANWSAETGTIGHGNNSGYPHQWGSGSWAENAAWGYAAEDGDGDFFTGWYYQEKADYTQQAQTDPKTGKVYQPHAKDDERYQTGHYLNVINRNWKYTGMAYTPSGSYGTTAVNDFSSGNALGGRTGKDKTYTTDQLRDLIAQAREEGVQKYEFKNGGVVYIESETDAQIAELESKLTDLRTQLSGAQKTAASAQTTLDDATTALKTAQTNLDAIGERPTDESLQTAYDEALAEYQEAVAAQETAEDELEETKADVADKVAKLTGQQATLESQLKEAQGQIDGLKEATASALSDLEEAEKDNEAVINAGEAYRTAKANAEAARAAEAEAQKTVDALSDAINELEGKVKAAQTDVDKAQAAYDAAGPTEQQKQDLASAEQALADAKAELERLTDARDEAKGLAEAAKKAAEDNDELIEKLASQIAEQQALIDDADEKLPAATAKADAWTAVFEQQDAESIVKDGFAGTTDDAEVAGALAAAHSAYEAKLEELETAKAKLEAAEEALEAAKADKETTAEELAAAEADYAMAKEAYDKLCAMMGWGEEPEQTVQQAGGRTPEQQAKLEALPTTGDPAAVAGAVALVGIAAVAGCAHFRRRRDAE